MKNLYLLLGFVCLYGFVEPIGNAASSYPVASYHPRIIINRDLNLAALKARAFGSMNADYQSLVKLFNPAGNLCGLSENYTMSNIYGIGYLYQMSGNVAYADYLIDGFLLTCDLGTALESDANPAFQLEAAAVAFDWVYDRIVARDKITPGLKQSIITRLKAAYTACSGIAFFRDAIRESDFHNYTTAYEAAFVMIGLALYGEDPAALEMLQRGWGMISEGYPFDPTGFGESVTFRLKSSIDLTDGAMNWEGSQYWRSSVPQCLRAIEAFDSATNRQMNVWSTQFANTINAGYYRLYIMRPDGTIPAIGDATEGTNLSWKDNFGLVILMDRFRDGHLRQLIDTDKGGWYGGYGFGISLKLLFYDPAIVALPFTDLPFSRQFGRDIVMRSGWGPSDTFMTLSAGFGGVYHAHLDDNAFTLFKYSDLAASGGYSLATPYYQNYFKRTVAHNAITVFDPLECWRDNSSSCTLSNDGGQRWNLRRFSPPYTKYPYYINRLWSGSLLSDPLYSEQFITATKTFDTKPEYDYIVSDATKAYTYQWSGQGGNTGNRVSKAIRQLVYLRGDYVVILDRVAATNANFEKSWLFHSVNPPKALVGGVWTTPAVGIQDFSTKDMLVDNGPGRLFIHTVLPAAPRARTIGGPGYEGWVNGKNNWPTTALAGAPTWRFEIKPTVPQTEDLFLNVLYPTASTTTSMPATMALDAGTMTGAYIADPGKPAVVLFSKTGALQSTVSYTVNYSGTGRHIIGDFEPGTYLVLRNGAAVGQYTVASGGALYFEATSGGQFQVGGQVAGSVVTFATTPAGLPLTVDGAACATPCTFVWPTNSTHTIAAATQAGATGVQYAFASWSDGGGASHSVTASAATTYTANFTTQYLLTTAANPAGGGALNPGTGWQNAGAVIGVSAMVNSGYQFAGFFGAVSGASPQSFTMNAPASITANFALANSSSWYNAAGTWTNRKAITIDHTKVAGDLTNFPVLISLTDANLAGAAKVDGSDILFTSCDGLTRLNYEIEQYTSATGQLVAWVNIPALSSVSDTILYLYYGNPTAANQQNAAAVWDSNFKGVWHFRNPAALSLDDSTTANNGSPAGTPAPAAGLSAGAVSLNGSTGAVNVGHAATLNVGGGGAFTIEAWVKPSSTSSRFGVFTTRGVNDPGSWQLEVGNSGTGDGAVALTGGPGTLLASTAAGAISSGSWSHVVATKNGPGDTALIYVNGVSMLLAQHSAFTAIDNLRDKFIGEGNSGTQFFSGLIDEVRLSNFVRSAAWIATEYNNLRAPDTFFTAGTPQTFADVPVAVTITSSPAGRSLTVDGSACAAPCSFQWPQGSTHSIAAATAAGAAGTQYLFTNWSDRGIASHIITTPVTATTYTAAFTTQYFLTTATSLPAGGTIAPASGWYDAASVVPVSASINAGYQFSGFSGALSGTTSPQNVTMNAPVSVTANFSGLTALTLTTSPVGLSLTVDGSACSAPCSFQWPQGSTHKIAAATATGAAGTQYLFANWSDGGLASHTITTPVTATTYTAAFTTQYFLTTAVSPAAGGVVTPASGWYNAGADLVVSATPNSGYQFSGLSGAVSAATSPQNVAVNAPGSVTANFTPIITTALTWYSTGGTWTNRKAITIDHSRVAGNLSNFPVLVSIIDLNLQSTAKPDGSDILFTASDGVTKLNHELNQYNSASGQLVAWVSLPAISSTADTLLYMYYGNPTAAAQQNTAGVWDSNYKGVWHFGNASNLSLSDATGVNTSTNHGATAVAGETSGGAAFNGAGKYVATTGLSLAANGSHTAGAWVKLNVINSGLRQAIIETASDYSLSLGWRNDGSGNIFQAYTDTSGGGFAVNSVTHPTTGTWYYLVTRVDAVAKRIDLFVNGVKEGSATWTGNVNPGAGLNIGTYRSANDRWLNGALDEVRVSTTTRTDQWIATEYNNENMPGSFYSVGAQESNQ